jgi:hypothetical protein
MPIARPYSKEVRIQGGKAPDKTWVEGTLRILLDVSAFVLYLFSIDFCTIQRARDMVFVQRRSPHLNGG